MQYQPTIHVTVDDVDALYAGTKTMQPGQWFQLPWADTPSRWAGITRVGGSIWASHTYRNAKGKIVLDGGNRKFSALCQGIARRAAA